MTRVLLRLAKRCSRVSIYLGDSIHEDEDEFSVSDGSAALRRYCDVSDDTYNQAMCALLLQPFLTHMGSPQDLSATSDVALAVLSVLLLIGLHKLSFTMLVRHRHRHLPPGPRPLPLIGNLLEVIRISRAQRPWIAYRELSKKYGEFGYQIPRIFRQVIYSSSSGQIVSLRTMGRCLVMINNIDIALELLKKRSAIYSSRPKSALSNLCAVILY